MMKQLTLAALGTVSLMAAESFGTVITQWNFNGATAANTSPSTGSGVLSNVGGTTLSASTGSGSPGDTATAGTTNYAYRSTTFPTASSNSGTAGTQYAVSTAGQQNIQLSFDLYASGSASKYYQLLYTTDGTNYSAAKSTVGTAVNAANYSATGISSTFDTNGVISLTEPSGQGYAYPFTFTFNSGSAVENDVNFGFRLVSVFDPNNNTSYTAATSGTTYAGTGNFRQDLVTVSSVPEPTVMATLSIGGLTALARRRRSI